MREISEKDWKLLKKIKDKLLQRFCNDALDKLKPVIENRGSDSHQAYLNLWKILNQKDKELSMMFDDLKRSTAFFKLASWQKSGFLSDKEFGEFSEETKDVVSAIISF